MKKVINPYRIKVAIWFCVYLFLARLNCWSLGFFEPGPHSPKYQTPFVEKTANVY